MTYLWVAIGSALGGVGRYWCGVAFAERLGEGFPWGTIFVNVTGSFVIGAVAAMGASLDWPWLPAHHVRAFVVVGLCGGYTTFSAFSLQTLTLLQEGAWAAALGNVALSVAVCLIAVWLGYLAGLGLNQAHPG